MDIEQLRARIDRLDRRIVALITERARAAASIGQAKNRHGKPILAPEREEAVLRHVERHAHQGGIVSPDAIRAIYSEVISACRAVERPLRVAYLGPEGTFSHYAARSFRWPASQSGHAARRRFGYSVQLVPVPTIAAVFAEVAQGHSDYGVAPIENSTEGGIGATMDLLAAGDLKVCAEIHARVEHALLARANAGIVRAIYSKAEVFGQCRHWLMRHYPKARLVEAASTAQAAQLASRQKQAAAICHEEAAAIYGLKVLHRNIEDNPFNTTRFYVLGRHAAAPSGKDKTSIICFVRNEPGALYNVLQPFWKAGINLTRIESRPCKGKRWEYAFFIDLAGHSQTPVVARALEKVRRCRQCGELKLIGSYPAAS